MSFIDLEDGGVRSMCSTGALMPLAIDFAIFVEFPVGEKVTRFTFSIFTKYN